MLPRQIPGNKNLKRTYFIMFQYYGCSKHGSLGVEGFFVVFVFTLPHLIHYLNLLSFLFCSWKLLCTSPLWKFCVGMCVCVCVPTCKCKRAPQDCNSWLLMLFNESSGYWSFAGLRMFPVSVAQRYGTVFECLHIFLFLKCYVFGVAWHMWEKGWAST